MTKATCNLCNVTNCSVVPDDTVIEKYAARFVCKTIKVHHNFALRYLNPGLRLSDDMP